MGVFLCVIYAALKYAMHYALPTYSTPHGSGFFPSRYLGHDFI